MDAKRIFHVSRAKLSPVFGLYDARSQGGKYLIVNSKAQVGRTQFITMLHKLLSAFN